MTVAAVILAASPASALADADGMPRVRREADAAWAGGATPVVVVAADPEGRIAVALSGAPAILAEPAPAEGGPVAQIVRGLRVAADAVLETDAALVWPARMAWVDPETVTTLIEAHGLDRAAIQRPSYAERPGWPALLPMAILDVLPGLGPDRLPDDLVADLADRGLPVHVVEVGDPGTVVDGDTPRSELPAYQGPPQPPADHVHEWGAPIADEPEDAGAPPRTVPFGERT